MLGSRQLCHIRGLPRFCASVAAPRPSEGRPLGRTGEGSKASFGKGKYMKDRWLAAKEIETLDESRFVILGIWLDQRGPDGKALEWESSSVAKFSRWLPAMEVGVRYQKVCILCHGVRSEQYPPPLQ